jgi:4-carboxymuconolactone decarboxylase
MPEDKQPSGPARMFGDLAPALVGFTDDVLFGQVCKRP